MRLNVEFIEEVGDTGLEFDMWFFSYADFSGCLVLEKYVRISKRTKRHRAKEEYCYRRIGLRGSISLANVPFTEEIKAKAKQLFIEKIQAELVVSA